MTSGDEKRRSTPVTVADGAEGVSTDHESAPSEGGKGVLEGHGLVKTYSGVEVLHHVDLTLRTGSVIGLVGENGAGKSTVSGIIAGSHGADAGTMTLDGVPYNPQTPAEALQSGVGIIHQEIRTIPDLTVAENIFLGHLPKVRGRVNWQAMYRDAADALATIGASIDPRRRVDGISIAQQQEIEIAKAISRNLRFIIFDEPTASLGPTETDHVLQRIGMLKSQGIGVMYISHRLEEVLQVSDGIVCLRDGSRVASWDDLKEVDEDDLVDAMVGRHVVYDHEPPKPPEPEIVLGVDKLSREGAFEPVSFEVHRGEIFGIAGLVGAGRSEVVRALAGVDRHDGGTVVVNGKQVDLRGVRRAMDAGIVMVPENRKEQGLDLEMSGYRNIALPWEHLTMTRGMVREREIRALAIGASESLEQPPRLDLPVKSLSGGNQQKVLVSKWLARRPTVLILDEPTRGVDVGAKAGIHRSVKQLAEDGIAVIVVSSELEEVLALSHRVMVMSEGHSQGVLDRSDATPEKVMSMAVGRVQA